MEYDKAFFERMANTNYPFPTTTEAVEPEDYSNAWARSPVWGFGQYLVPQMSETPVPEEVAERNRRSNFVQNFLTTYATMINTHGSNGSYFQPQFFTHVQEAAKAISETPPEEMNGRLEAVVAPFSNYPDIAEIVRHAAMGEMDKAYSAAENLMNSPETQRAILNLEHAISKYERETTFVGPGTGP